MNEILLNIIKLIGIVAIQIFILNGINLHGFINPMIYPLFLMLLPLETSSWLLMIIGFFYGLLLDSFGNIAGLNASVCVTMAALRPMLLRIVQPISGYEQKTKLTIYNFGLVWFIRYTLIFMIVHHILYFTIEIWSFKYLGYTIFKIFFSFIFSSLLAILLIIIFSGKKRLKNT